MEEDLPKRPPERAPELPVPEGGLEGVPDAELSKGHLEGVAIPKRPVPEEEFEGKFSAPNGFLDGVVEAKTLVLLSSP